MTTEEIARCVGISSRFGVNRHIVSLNYLLPVLWPDVLPAEIGWTLDYGLHSRTLLADESTCIQQTVCIFVIVLLSRDQRVDADFV